MQKHVLSAFLAMLWMQTDIVKARALLAVLELHIFKIVSVLVIVGLINGNKVQTIHVNLVILRALTVMVLVITSVMHAIQDIIYSLHQIILLV